MSKSLHPARRHLLKLTLLGLLCSASVFPLLTARAEAVSSEDAPVDFTAQQVAYDDINQTVVALGDVEITQNGKVVKVKDRGMMLTTYPGRKVVMIISPDSTGRTVVLTELMIFKEKPVAASSGK